MDNNNNLVPDIGLAVRVFAYGLGHTKDSKNGT